MIFCAGAVTGRSPSPSTPSEDDFTAPVAPVASKQVPAGNSERTSPEPEPEPRKLLTAGSEGDAAELMLEMAMEEGDPQDPQDDEAPEAEMDVEHGDVDPLDPLDPLDPDPLDPELNAEAEHLALEQDLETLEAELAMAEQLLRDPQDPQLPAESADSVASMPVVAWRCLLLGSGCGICMDMLKKTSNNIK